MPTVQKSGPSPIHARHEAEALDALAALSHSTRMRIFRYLASLSPLPASAGQISDAVDTLPATLSSHLAILVRAGLIQGQKDGRSIAYWANFNAVGDLVRHLLKECCDGRKEAYLPVIKSLKQFRKAA